MFLLSLLGRPRRSATSFRTRLGVEWLDGRNAPSSLVGAGEEPQDTLAWSASFGPVSDPIPARDIHPPLGDPAINEAPRIENYTVEQIGAGLYKITGRVVDESPAGLVISFGGVPSAEGQSATVQSDGSFEHVLELKTDGSDSGLLTAVTSDSAGQTSNLAAYYVNPAT